jgi:hypothetical protein
MDTVDHRSGCGNGSGDGYRRNDTYYMRMRDCIVGGYLFGILSTSVVAGFLINSIGGLLVSLYKCYAVYRDRPYNTDGNYDTPDWCIHTHPYTGNISLVRIDRLTIFAWKSCNRAADITVIDLDNGGNPVQFKRLIYLSDFGAFLTDCSFLPTDLGGRRLDAAEILKRII